MKAKRYLSLFLALGMLVSMCAVPAYAEEETDGGDEIVAADPEAPEEEPEAEVPEDEAPSDEPPAEAPAEPDGEEPEDDPTEEPPDEEDPDAEVEEEEAETEWLTVSSVSGLSAFIGQRFDSDSYFQLAQVNASSGAVTVDGVSASAAALDLGDVSLCGDADEVADGLEDAGYAVICTEGSTITLSAPFQTCRLIVHTTDMTDAAGAETALYYTPTGMYVLQYATPAEAKAAYEELSQVYSDISPDYVVHAPEAKDSSSDAVETQDDVEYYSWGVGYMGLDACRAQKWSGSLTVAVIDSGCDDDNWFFEGRTFSKKSYDFIAGKARIMDDYGSGTYNTAVIADGTPTNVAFMILRTFDASGNGDLATIESAIHYARTNGADLIFFGSYLYTYPEKASAVTTLDKELKACSSAGIPFITPAGNLEGMDYMYGLPNDTVYSYPACSQYTVAVSGIGSYMIIDPFSFVGDAVDFTGPGDDIAVPQFNGVKRGVTVRKEGTQLAAAHIAAAYSVLMLKYPSYSISKLYDTAKSLCDTLGYSGRSGNYGWGCPILSDLESNAVDLDAPVLSSAAITDTGVTLNWKQVTDATGYYIYRRTADGSYEKLGTVKSGSTLKYTDTSAGFGTVYTYAVKAYARTSVSAYSNPISVCRTASPALSALKNVTTGLKLTWGKVTAATGYEVYRKAAGDSAYTLVKALSGGSAVTWTDTTVTGGAKYTYYVVSIWEKSGFRSSSPAGESLTAIRVGTPDMLAVTSVSGGLQVSWSCSADNGGITYTVKRRTGSGSYKTLRTLTDTCVLLDSTVTAGQSYTYQVTAAGTDGYTVTGTAMSGTVRNTAALGTPKITSLVNNTNNTTLKWSSVSGADGYYIYRAKGNGEFSLLTTVSGTVTSYDDSRILINGSAYRYRVAAVQTDSTGTAQGGLSPIRTIYRLIRPTFAHINCISAGIKLEWYRNSGATGIRIYRSTDGGAMTLVQTISDNTTTSWTDTSATGNGTRYQYKLVYFKNAGTFTCSSAGVTATKIYLSVATLSIPHIVDTGICVYWGCNTACDGYKVCRSENGGAFKVVANVSGYLTGSWKDTSVKADSEYSYKVVAYKVWNGNTYNGVYSKTEKAVPMGE